MTQGFLQIGLTLCILIVITPFFGRYIARVFLGETTVFDSVFNPVERIIYILGGIRSKQDMTGSQYIRAVLFSNFIMGVVVYLILKFQGILPFNPMNLKALSWDLALHTTISFLTNTDQQHYIPEITLSYFSQTAALGFLMFTSAATGLAVGIAFIRGLTGRPLGNFYVDLVRGITRILLPISLLGAIALIILGTPQTLLPTQVVTTLEGGTQYIARGPVASFEMIKQLGENGGGFFAANSAHPFENPNGASNLIEMLAMLSIPAALIYTYGLFANNTKQAWLLFWMVFAIFIILVAVTASSEYQGNTLVNAILGYEIPNLEGKEVRFGSILTAFWAIATTSTMTGAVNGMHDSLMPTGGFATLLNMFLQIIWGGQGTGTAYLFIYLILTVFLTGLMVGRTPEFLGRKIEKREIVLASLVLLIHPIAVLIPSAITLYFPETLAGINNPGFHGVSQVVYEYTSASANNGSGFEGLADNSLWWNLSTIVSLLLGRYVPIIAILLLADSMTRKQTVPATPGTLRTDTLLFTSVTAGVILILGVLTFFPVLALGPIAEGFKIASGR
ncbi:MULTISPECIES: potassium-transporting ATPase subunit KdpA [Fischerella]|jgi:K+-transporting ATPase ATPase A chain|uniref:Potassium-transporting ATPase potassium-binding subunit n=3 Tax=Fischerella TaxID=1190 RepID=G6FNI7_9CYAN|nr:MULTISPECIES: potassium-transporting ATPase subunit KdpA [Fischerella]PLZ90366.1 potassium-transporting ATPase subunit A [Fischerella thermalis CCMEE 5196]EHC19617.1 Potassium-transporting ATPase A chain [Fischerella thermalis JSC-11]OKH11007.1 potassium-transporting ATPase subunit KdpA [Fischerella major NIES-592]PLZ09994.1 potassium-transporting ATPase subunit A [Fischerella thermalis WC114]PLZ13430.1 potassium-transporting ATPase subunit A [Fischerella thermalis WC119]